VADKSAIEWTDATWNPVTGCTEVSPGCDRCYAKTFAERWRGVPGHHFENGFDVTLRPERLDQPLRWKKPRRIFTNSMSDLFHDSVPDEFIAEVFAVMALAKQHVFQVLTKRHGRMRSLLNGRDFRTAVQRAALVRVGGRAPWLVEPWWPLANVWLGVSVEDQKWADIRVPALLDTPAAVRFLSCEPLLGPVDLDRWLTWPSDGSIRHDLDWLICGGESGHGARPMHPDWARSLRNQCAAAGVPYFFKQTGSLLARELGIPGKGHEWDLLPEEFRIRDYPQVVANV
jgi:protein gp37